VTTIKCSYAAGIPAKHRRPFGAGLTENNQAHQEASFTRKHYEVEELEAKLERARFRMEFLSPYMTTIFPRLWLVRRLAGAMWMGRGEPADESVLVEKQFRVVPPLNPLLVASLHWESRRPAKRRRLPFGTSIVALARKRS